MELNLKGLLNNVIHVLGYSGENGGFMYNDWWMMKWKRFVKKCHGITKILWQYLSGTTKKKLWRTSVRIAVLQLGS
jgi:hypothetical protein